MAEDSASGWEEQTTAQKYFEFSQQFPLYKISSHDLVDLVNLEKGMTVVDLACGTGTSTKEVLQKVGSTGKIFAVDASSSMLEKARSEINQDNVAFIKSQAEELDLVIPEKSDVVVCNSGIWDMEIDKTFKVVRNVLKPKGLFAFSIPGQFFRFTKPSINRNDHFITLPLLAFSIARSKYGLTDRPKYSSKDVLTTERIRTSAESSGFFIKETREETYDRTAEQVYKFEQIPVMTEKLLPGMDYETRMRALDDAYELVDKSLTYPSKWAYFLTQRVD